MVTAMRRHQRAGQLGDLRDRLCTTTVNVPFKVLPRQMMFFRV